MKNIHQKVALFYLVLFISRILLLGACTAKYEREAAPIASDSAYDLIAATPTSLKITLQPTPYISTPSRTPQSNTLKPKNTELQGCIVPSDDYSRLEINGHQLNHRTYEMLAQAQTVYDGEINFTGEAITQGSYTNAVGASFGTHAGGGAVDLSVMQPGTYTILYSDIEKIIQALRITGFAAWYRDFDALYPGSPPHIHAIAIG